MAALKAVHQVLDAAPVLDSALMQLLRWTADYYHHPFGEVIAAALPKALRAGARSYVLKEAEPAELLQAFRLAVAGGNYLHPRLGALMATGEDGGADGVVLSEREREVVRLIANGYTNPEIAEKLNVAERTVKTYRARAIEKLGFSSRAEITAYVRRIGLAD